MSRWRRPVAALSLANLCFVEVWYPLLVRKFSYLMEDLPLPREYAAVVLCVLTTASVVFLASEIVARTLDRWFGRVAALAFLLTLLIPMNIFRLRMSANEHDLAMGRAIMLVYAVAAAFFVLRPSMSGRMIRVVETALIIASPFVLVTFAQSAWRAATWRANPQKIAKPHAAEGRRRPRVVWMIFDELDERYAFTNRPPSLSLPALDRLRSESFYADHAYPPAYSTITSIPSLLTGTYLTKVDWSTTDDLVIEPQGGGFESLQRHQTIFSQMRQIGGRSGVVGWFHPYCRLFGDQLTDCEAHTSMLSMVKVKKLRRGRASIGTFMKEDARQVLLKLPFSFRMRNKRPPDVTQSEWQRRRALENSDITAGWQRQHIDDYRRIEAAAIATIRDERVDLVYIHWPVPHGPYIFDRRTGKLSTGRVLGYFDNLALVDATVDQVGAVISTTARVGATTLVISSDHFWREQGLKSPHDYRIPFLVRFPDGRGVTYSRPFNTFITANLLLAVAKEEVRSAAEAAQWLDRHGTFSLPTFLLPSGWQGGASGSLR